MSWLASEALGQAWSGKGVPPPGFLRRRDAQALLDELLVEARRGQLRQERTGLTFADVAEEWYQRGRFERDWSASTQVDYRSVLDAHMLPEFGPKRIETFTSEQVERWRNGLIEDGAPRAADGQQDRHATTRDLRARRRAPRPARQPRREGQAPTRVLRRCAL